MTATVQENALFKKQAVEEYLADYEALIQHMIDNSGGNIVERLNKVYDEYELGDSYPKDCFSYPKDGYNYSSDEWQAGRHPYLHVNTDISINVGALKEDVQKLEQDYLQLVKLSFSELYFRLVEIAPMAIVAMLWSDTFRELLIGENANAYLKDSFNCQNISVDKKYPVLLRTIIFRESNWYYIFEKFSRKWAIPNIDGLKIMFFRPESGKEEKIIETGNKIILLYSNELYKSAADSNTKFVRYGSPALCDGLIVKGSVWPYRQFVIYMSA